MRILFIGSIPENDYNRDPAKERELQTTLEHLWTAAGELGYIAAMRGNTIIVGSERITTIDYHVVSKGLLKAAKNNKSNYYLEVFRPDDDKRPFEQVLPSNVKGKWFIRRPGFPLDTTNTLQTKKPTSTWLFAHQSAIASSDVVIAMAGGNGTRTAIYVAENMNVPVIPIPSFGGGAADALQDLVLPYKNNPLAHHVKGEWTSKRAEGIIRLAESIGKHSYFISHSHEDVAWCDYVNLCLFDNGRTVLRDRNLLRIGEPVQEVLDDAIGRAETFLLLWSSNSASSKWCEYELNKAISLNKKGLPPRRIVAIVTNGLTPPRQLKNVLSIRVDDTTSELFRDANSLYIEKLVSQEKAV